MDNERLLAAITAQGNSLRDRANYLQKVLEQRVRGLVKAEETVNALRVTLEATYFALDALRAEYLKMIPDGSGTAETEPKEEGEV